MSFTETTAKAWTAFKKWRVDGWPFRVVVLLLIFAMPIYESLSGDSIIKRLVANAVEAILMDSEPRLANAKAHYYNVRDIHNLRFAIRSHFDMNHDGILDTNEFMLLRLDGMNPSDLFKTSIYANASAAEMEFLASFAKRYDIVPNSYNAKELRKQALYAGLAEVQLDDAQGKAEIAEMLSSHFDPNNLKTWDSWKRGSEDFLYSILDLLSDLSPLQTPIAWLLFCCLGSAVISTKAKNWRKTPLCVGIPLLITFGLMAFNLGNMLFSTVNIEATCLKIALLILVVASALKGMKMTLTSGRFLDITFWTLIAWIAMAVIAGSGFCTDSLRMNGIWEYFCSCVLFGHGMGNYIIPSSVLPWGLCHEDFIAFSVVGVVIASILLLAIILRKRA